MNTWEIIEDDWEIIITDRAGHTVCSMPKLKDLKANANLIAAAPDMYEALKNLLLGLDNPMRIPAFELVDKASLALAKAEGKEV